MAYPNSTDWFALQEGIVETSEGKFKLTKITCGELKIPSGQLVVCDPFAGLSKTGNAYVSVAPGQYEVVVTLADVSEQFDGSHFREAYATLVLVPNAIECERKLLRAEANAQADQSLQPSEYYGYPVDAGTSCFTDAQAIAADMPPEEEWFEGLFENDDPDSWFNQMDDPSNIRRGLANITLPNSSNNLVLFHSGWGDGVYPIVGGFDAAGQLIAVHTDFHVVSLPEEQEDEPQKKDEKTKTWWQFWK